MRVDRKALQRARILRQLRSEQVTARNFQATAASEQPAGPGLPWLAGVAAGAQTGIVSLLLLVFPAVTVFVAAAGDPANAQATWGTAMQVGARLWFLGHGGMVTNGAADVTISPLGVALLTGLLAFMFGKRAARPNVASVATATGTVACFVVAAGISGGNATGWGLLRAAVVTLLVTGLAFTVGVMRQAEAPTWEKALAYAGKWLPAWVVHGVRTAVATFMVATVFTVALFVWWVAAGHVRISQIVISLAVGWFSMLMLLFTQWALLPNFLVWMLSFMAGSGFSVGVGTSFSPSSVTAGPLPALPLLGALPQPSNVGGLWRFLPLALVLAGIVGGWIGARKARSQHWWEPFAAAGIAIGVIVAVAAAVAGLASGSAGTIRMADLGVEAVVFAPRLGLLCGGGLLVALAVWDEALRSAVQLQLAKVRRRTPKRVEAATELISLAERRELGEDFFDPDEVAAANAQAFDAADVDPLGPAISDTVASKDEVQDTVAQATAGQQVDVPPAPDAVGGSQGKVGKRPKSPAATVPAAGSLTAADPDTDVPDTATPDTEVPDTDVPDGPGAFAGFKWPKRFKGRDDGEGK